MAPRIRPAIPQDMEGLLAIQQSSFPTAWSESEFSYAMETEHEDCLVLPDADARDPILGYCVISRAADEGEIVSVAIAPSKRGRGYGSLLLTDVFALEKEKGISTIFLEVRQSNAPAMALYEKIGFYPVGIRPKYYADTKEDARIYRKDL